MKDAIILNRENELSLICGWNIDASLTSIDIALSPNLGVVSKESPHLLKERDARHKLSRIVTRKLLNRRKRPTINCWRLNDKEFDELDRTYSFTLEDCCEPLGLNGHHNLLFYSEQHFVLDLDFSGQTIYCNPPWSLAIKCAEHLRACHFMSPLDTKAIIVLPDCPCPLPPNPDSNMSSSPVLSSKERRDEDTPPLTLPTSRP